MRQWTLALLLAVGFAVGSIGTALAACDYHTAKADERIATPIVLPDDDSSDG
jgi:hypothetical protein